MNTSKLRATVRRVAVTTVAAAIVAVGLPASPASANTAGWRTFQLDTDSCWDAAVWFDQYGRMTANAWFNLGRTCVWDTYVRDTNGDGAFDESWFNTLYDSNWDTLLIGNRRWDGQNQWSGSGLQVQGPHGTWWANSGFTSMTVTRPTSPSAFYNLMTTLTAHTGIAVG